MVMQDGSGLLTASKVKSSTRSEGLVAVWPPVTIRNEPEFKNKKVDQLAIQLIGGGDRTRILVLPKSCEACTQCDPRRRRRFKPGLLSTKMCSYSLLGVSTVFSIVVVVVVTALSSPGVLLPEQHTVFGENGKWVLHGNRSCFGR
jgi:hypothetical protein